MRPAWLILILLCSLTAPAAEVMPPRPAQYFNDYAHVVSPAVAAQLNQTLETFERQTSEQILVAVYPKMQSVSAIEDYTVRIARAWRVGQTNLNNGAVLFVFAQDRKLFLQVGYGLEGVLPDALCKRIIEEQITPHFRAGDFDAGLVAGVQAILAAARGEYKGTGRTAAETRRHQGNGLVPLMIFALALMFFVFFLRGGRSRRHSGWTIGSGGLWGGGWSGGGGGCSVYETAALAQSGFSEYPQVNCNGKRATQAETGGGAALAPGYSLEPLRGSI